MLSMKVGAVLALCSTLANAVLFDGPVATPVVGRGLDANGWTPKPTNIPGSLPELFKRQMDPSFCGYLEGDPEYAMTCKSGASCRYAETLGWWGCCTGTRVADCNIATTCVESTSISSCLANSKCTDDDYLTACTARSSGACVLLNTVIFSKTYAHYECASRRTTYEVIYTTSKAASSVLRSSRSSSLDTDSASATRFQLSTRPTSPSASTNEEKSSTSSSASAESSSGGNIISFSRSVASSATGGSTPLPTPTLINSAQLPSSTRSTGGARRTAEAMLGAAGGLAGLLAVLL